MKASLSALEYERKYKTDQVLEKYIKENIFSENPVPNNIKVTPSTVTYINERLIENKKILTLNHEDGFLAVGMSTDGGFRVGYTISLFVSLVLSLLDFLRLLLIIFKYSIFLVFFIKCFFSTQDCTFPITKGLVNFVRRDLGEMFTDVTSLQLFLNIPLFIGKFFIFKDAG